MTAIPWFKFYAADYLTDPGVDNLCLEAQGILVRMWSVAWLEGSLPSDVDEIARKCKVRCKTMHMHADKLLKFFVRQEDGAYVSERMRDERERSGLTSERRKAAANKRWSKPDAIASANTAANSNARLGVKSHPVRDQKPDFKTLPPTPLEGGSMIWQKVRQILKDDLSTAYVNVGHFEENEYDKYFRDATVSNVVERKLFLSHPEPNVLREGVRKYQKRLAEAFASVGFRDIELEIVSEHSDQSKSDHEISDCG